MSHKSQRFGDHPSAAIYEPLNGTEIATFPFACPSTGTVPEPSLRRNPSSEFSQSLKGFFLYRV